VLLFHRHELRHRGLNAQFLGVGRVDTADQRLDDPLVGLAAQPPADERGHAFIAGVVAFGDERFAGHAEFAQQGNQWRDDHRPDLRRGHQQKPLRQFDQPAAMHDEHFAEVLIGRQQFVFHADAAAQVLAPGHVGDEAVGAAFDQHAVATHRT